VLWQWPTDTAFNASLFVERLLSAGISPRYRDRVRAITRLVSGASRRDVVRQFGNGSAAYDSVPAALCSFLRAPDDFASVIRFAIQLGGDTDTIASMAGALSGAFLGLAGIPAAWRELEGVEELARFADALLVLCTRNRSLTQA
jgi:poly(ADP-ribose) glycohydrolase ARH3